MKAPRAASRAFVGRLDELEALRDHYRYAASGHGRLLLVGGDAGIGKSRLVGEFRESLASGRSRYLALGECLEHAARPYGPLREIIASLLRSVPWIATQTGPAVSVAIATLAPYALSAAETERFANIPFQKADLFAAILQVFTQLAAKRTLVVIVEDIHWADPATLELLTYLAPRIASTRALFIATYRTDELHRTHALFPALGRLEHQSTVHRLAIGPLSLADMRSLLHLAADGHPLPTPDELREIEDLAEGNPFFGEELLKNAFERLQSKYASTFPNSVSAVVFERLARLGIEAQDVLAHAAILGHRFDPTLLAAIAKRALPSILNILSQACDKQILLEDGGEAPAFRFRHALARAAISDAMLAAQVRPVHAEIATLLESLPDTPGRVYDLAYHSWKAGIPDKTLVYNERAGDQALSLRAYADAQSYFTRAIDANDDDGVRARLLTKFARAAEWSGQPQLALKAIELARVILVTRREYDEAALLAVRETHQLNNSGDLEGAIASIDANLTAFGDLVVNEQHRYRMHVAKALIVSNCHDSARALDILANVARPDGLEDDLACTYWSTRSMAHACEGKLHAWENDIVHLRTYLDRQPPYSRAMTESNVALTATLQGASHAAEAALRVSSELSEEWGFAGVAALAKAERAFLRYLRGDLPGARNDIIAALPESEMFFIARFHIAFAGPVIGVALGDEELVARSLDDGVSRRMLERRALGAYCVLLGAQAMTLVAAGEQAQARAIVHEAIERLPTTFSCMVLLPLAARIADERHLAMVRRMCADAAKEKENRVMLATHALVEAIAAERAADVSTVMTHAYAAVERYRALGWPLFEAQALELAARPDEALAIYRRCGCVHDVRRLDLCSTGGRVRSAEGGLSEREREIARYVARGSSNRAVADALGLSEKTVEKHLTSIYSRLKLTSRSQLAGFMSAQDVKTRRE